MIDPNFQHNRLRPRRRGLVSVVILIGLIIVGLICAGLLKVAIARRAEVLMEERRLQANWLAESALDRASARLADSEAYAGETWEIGPEELGGRGPGSVLIRVTSIPEHPDRRRVTVRADYPSDSSRRARRSLEVVLPVTPNAR
jgi:type II secretory pathway pseudopilin PulG